MFAVAFIHRQKAVVKGKYLREIQSLHYYFMFTENPATLQLMQQLLHLTTLNIIQLTPLPIVPSFKGNGLKPVSNEAF